MTRSTLMLLSGSIVLIGGCHVSRGTNGSNDQVQLKADGNGEVSFNLPFAKGSMKLPDGMIQNGNIDIDGVKMIPGGTIRGFNMDGGDKGATVHLAFDAPKSPDEVRAYFADQLKQKGDAITQSGTAISGKTKDGDVFVIDVKPGANGSTGTIALNSKD